MESADSPRPLSYLVIEHWLHCTLAIMIGIDCTLHAYLLLLLVYALFAPLGVCAIKNNGAIRIYKARYVAMYLDVAPLHCYIILP